jgi:hypothetical protein
MSGEAPPPSWIDSGGEGDSEGRSPHDPAPLAALHEVWAFCCSSATFWPAAGAPALPPRSDVKFQLQIIQNLKLLDVETANRFAGHDVCRVITTALRSTTEDIREEEADVVSSASGSQRSYQFRVLAQFQSLASERWAETEFQEAIAELLRSGVRPAHFPFFAAAVLEAVRERLIQAGVAFGPEIEAEWKEFLGHLLRLVVRLSEQFEASGRLL